MTTQHRNNKDEQREVIENYVLNRMDDEDRIAFEEQLLFDTELQSQVVQYEIIYKAINHHATQEKLEYDRQIEQDGMFYLRLAAMIIVGVFTTSYVLQQQGFQITNYLPATHDDHTTMFYDSDFYASAFEPNPYLEDFITQVFRNDSQQVVITYPAENTELGARAQTQVVRFSAIIPQAYHSEPLLLKLYTNSTDDYLNEISLFGKELIIADGGLVETEIEVPLNRGLYYLVIENADTLEPRAVRRLWVR